MTEPPDSSTHVVLNNTTISTSISSQAPTTTNGAPTSTTQTNGQPKVAKPSKKPETKTQKPEDVVGEVGAGANLTGAQLKAQKKAEKAAKRAAEVAQRGAPQTQPPARKPELQRRPSATKREEDGGGSAHHKRAGSGSMPNNSNQRLPLRGPEPAEKERKSTSDKKVAIFSHLYPSAGSRKASLSSAGKEVHPAVLSLGLQLRDFVICGSTARTLAMLLVFKRVVADYTTPDGVALSRHLTTHLSHQIGFLSSCRGLCVSQGNSIRWLKKLVSGLDVGLGEAESKEVVLRQIDAFVRERFTLADELICTSAGERVADGDVVLVYGKSSVVEKALVASWKAGKRFRIVVVDSRPLFEGRNMARSLAALDIPVQYCLLNGLADVVDECSKCFMGASSMLGNGRLLARAGSAMVAMMVKSAGLPVIVLCESIKFTGRVALDSLVMNEIGDADSLVEAEESGMLTTTVQLSAPEPKKTTGKKGKEDDDPGEPKEQKGLEGWREIQNLQLLNLMYDVTPAEYLDMVITELGDLPPSAVPVVNGIHGGEE